MAVTVLPWRRKASAKAGSERAVRAPRTAEQRLRVVQIVLFTVGAILMPLGLVAILLGWYGVAHAHYAYDQTTYLISGGVLGVGLIMFGGFLYFGAWLVRSNADQRAVARELTAALTLLAQALPSTAEQPAAAGGEPVVVGDGRTVHRRDCPLVSHRREVRAVSSADADLVPCRVCSPLY